MDDWTPKGSTPLEDDDWKPKGSTPVDDNKLSVVKPATEDTGDWIARQAKEGLAGATDQARAAMSGMTYGLNDEAGAAISSIPVVGKYLNTPLWGKDAGKVPPESQTYRQSQQELQALDEGAVARNPGSALIGGLLAPNPLSKYKAATAGAKLVAEGLAGGTLYGLGGSHATDAAGQADDALAGGAFGVGTAGVLGGLGELASKPVQTFGEWLLEKAGNRAAKAAGFIQKDLNKLPEGAGQDIGRTLLDKGLVKFGRTAEELAPGFKASKSASGRDIGDIMSQADAASGGTGREVRAQVAARAQADADKQAAQAAAFKSIEGGVDDKIANAGKAQSATREGVEDQIQHGMTEAQIRAAQAESDHVAQRAVVEQGVRDAIKREAGYTRGVVPSSPDVLSRTYRRIASMPDGERERATQSLIETLHPRAVSNPLPEVASMATLPTRERSKAAADLADRLEANRTPRVDPTEPATYVGPQTKDLRAQHLADSSQDLAPPADKSSFSKGLGFNLRDFTDKLKSDAIPEFSDPAFGGMGAALKKQAARYDSRADAGVSFSEANRMKQNIQKTISKFTDTPASQQSRMKLQALLGDSIDKQVGSTLGEDAQQSLASSNKDFGQLAEAVKAARGAERRNLGNNALSLTSRLAGLGGIGAGAGSLVGHPILAGAAGLATALGHQALHGRGASAAAVSLNGVGNALGAYGPALQQAFQKGGLKAVLSLHQALKSLPDYPAEDIEEKVLPALGPEVAHASR